MNWASWFFWWSMCRVAGVTREFCGSALRRDAECDRPPACVALPGVLAGDKTSSAPLRHIWRLPHSLCTGALSQRHDLLFPHSSSISQRCITQVSPLPPWPSGWFIRALPCRIVVWPGTTDCISVASSSLVRSVQFWGIRRLVFMTEFKSKSAQTQPNSVYCAELRVSTYPRSSSGSQFVLQHAEHTPDCDNNFNILIVLIAFYGLAFLPRYVFNTLWTWGWPEIGRNI
jgi:hypothetical protein